MQVKELTVEEFKLLIRETVAETLDELSHDPDEGKQVRPEVLEELTDSLQRTQGGEAGIAAEEVARRLGMDW